MHTWFTENVRVLSVCFNRKVTKCFFKVSYLIPMENYTIIPLHTHTHMLYTYVNHVGSMMRSCTHLNILKRDSITTVTSSKKTQPLDRPPAALLHSLILLQLLSKYRIRARRNSQKCSYFTQTYKQSTHIHTCMQTTHTSSSTQMHKHNMST